MQSDWLNYSCPPLKILVGTLDIAPYVESLTLRRPRAEISTPYSWQGSLALASPLDRSQVLEPLDDLINPSRWARGVHPVTIYFNNILFATVRILEYFYNEDSYTAEVELGDVLTLLDFATPAKDYKGMGFTPCHSVPLTSIIVKSLQSAGISNFSVNVPGYIDVPPNKPNSSWIKFAQSYLGERGYWLYCDQNEVVRVAKYSVIPGTPLFCKPRQQVEKFDRQRSPDVPNELIVVTGSVEKFANCQVQYPQISEQFGYINSAPPSQNPNVIVTQTQAPALQNRETVTLVSQSSTHVTRKRRVQQARGVVFPEKYPGDAAVIQTELTFETKIYNNQGELVKSTEDTGKLLGAVLPEQFPNSTVFIANAEKVVEEYEGHLYNDGSVTTTASTGAVTPGGKGVMTKKQKTFWSLFPIGILPQDNSSQNTVVYLGQNYTQAIKEQTTETWTSACPTSSNIQSTSDCNFQRYNYKKRGYSRESEEISTDDLGFGQTFGWQPQFSGIFGPSPSYYSVPFWKLGALLPKVNLSKDTENAVPPAWETRPPICPTCTATIKAEVTLLPVGYTAYHERRYEYNASTLENNTEATVLAQLLGNLQHQRYRSRLISMPLPQEYLNNSAPFARIDCHNGSFICDSPSLVLGEDGLEVSFVGNYLGAIPSVQVPYQPPININLSPSSSSIGSTLVLTSLSQNLTISPISTDPLVFTAGVNSNIQIAISGGTPPYTVNAVNLPAGLNVVI